MGLYHGYKTEEIGLDLWRERMHEAHAERMEAEREEATEGILDDLKLTGKCRKCAWILETLDGFLDDENEISVEQLDYLSLSCVGCKGQGNGEPDEKHEERLSKEWNELTDWIKDMGIKNPARRCLWCKNVYEVYGHYKDPDDEWKAFEDLCKNCEIFQEV